MKTIYPLTLLTLLTAAGCHTEDAQPPTVQADFTIVGNRQSFVPIQFSNLSEKALTYSWDFGDGSAISTALSPTHTFRRAGTYTITLQANGEGATSSQKSQTLSLSRNADSLSAIITAHVGRYRFTKKANTCYGPGCPSTTPVISACDTTMTVSRVQSEIEVNNFRPTLRLISSNGYTSGSNQHYQFFTLTGGTSAANRMIAMFKHNSDSLEFEKSQGGTGGGSAVTYYGRKIQ